jgi:hypothetical protein
MACFATSVQGRTMFGERMRSTEAPKNRGTGSAGQKYDTKTLILNTMLDQEVGHLSIYVRPSLNLLRRPAPPKLGQNECIHLAKSLSRLLRLAWLNGLRRLAELEFGCAGGAGVACGLA